MFGTFLSWLNDHTSDVFVVCTANDVSRLPPEFGRSERFDGIFFLDLPTREEKDAIWALYREQFEIDRDQRCPEDEHWTGAEIKACCRLAALLDLVENGVVIGVESNHGRIMANFTIDAAGGRHWLAKKLQIPLTIESPRLVARYGYVEGDYATAHDIPTLTVNADGWTWIARVREQTCQWTRLGKSAASRYEKDPCTLPRHEPFDGPRAERMSTFGADVTWRCATKPAGPGYFLCGDAAAVLDPASSHGVLKGLMSGIYAGHLIEQVQVGLKSATVAEAEYSDWLIRWFQHDVVELRKHYSDMGLAELVGGEGSPSPEAKVHPEAHAASS
jgi:flavin-dependent dehydrogenase